MSINDDLVSLYKFNIFHAQTIHKPHPQASTYTRIAATAATFDWDCTTDILLYLVVSECRWLHTHNLSPSLTLPPSFPSFSLMCFCFVFLSFPFLFVFAFVSVSISFFNGSPAIFSSASHSVFVGYQPDFISKFFIVFFFCRSLSENQCAFTRR